VIVFSITWTLAQSFSSAAADGRQEPKLLISVRKNVRTELAAAVIDLGTKWIGHRNYSINGVNAHVQMYSNDRSESLLAAFDDLDPRVASILLHDGGDQDAIGICGGGEL
jgi:hypothetical protein